MNFIPSDDRHPFKYYWDENTTGTTANGKQYKGIVAAILEKDTWEVINKGERVGGKVDWSGRPEFFMQSSYKGVSYCSAEDGFDLRKGMRIAKLRALKKYYNNKWKILNKIGKTIMKDYDKVESIRGNAAYDFLETCYRLEKLEGGE